MSSFNLLVSLILFITSAVVFGMYGLFEGDVFMSLLSLCCTLAAYYVWRVFPNTLENEKIHNRVNNLNNTMGGDWYYDPFKCRYQDSMTDRFEED